jgi:hypothetical protein
MQETDSKTVRNHTTYPSSPGPKYRSGQLQPTGISRYSALIFSTTSVAASTTRRDIRLIYRAGWLRNSPPYAQRKSAGAE